MSLRGRMYPNGTDVSTSNHMFRRPSLMIAIPVIKLDGLVLIIGTLRNLFVLTVIFVHTVVQQND